MDGAWIGSIDISINKAFTSRAFTSAPRILQRFLATRNQVFGFKPPWRARDDLLEVCHSSAREGNRRRLR